MSGGARLRYRAPVRSKPCLQGFRPNGERDRLSAKTCHFTKVVHCTDDGLAHLQDF